LAKNNGNITRAAAELGISRPTLHDLIKKYSIVT
jgi:transcriptional regulator of acetoin/glycerol metabolism